MIKVDSDGCEISSVANFLLIRREATLKPLRAFSGCGIVIRMIVERAGEEGGWPCVDIDRYSCEECKKRRI